MAPEVVFTVILIAREGSFIIHRVNICTYIIYNLYISLDILLFDFGVLLPRDCTGGLMLEVVDGWGSCWLTWPASIIRRTWLWVLGERSCKHKHMLHHNTHQLLLIVVLLWEGGYMYYIIMLFISLTLYGKKNSLLARRKLERFPYLQYSTITMRGPDNQRC